MKSILSGGRALSPAKALALAVGLAFAATPAMAQAHYMCRAMVPPDMTLTPTPDGVVTLSTEGAGPGPRGRYITLDNVFTAEFVNFGSPGTNMVYVIDQRSMKGFLVLQTPGALTNSGRLDCQWMTMPPRFSRSMGRSGNEVPTPVRYQTPGLD